MMNITALQYCPHALTSFFSGQKNRKRNVIKMTRTQHVHLIIHIFLSYFNKNILFHINHKYPPSLLQYSLDLNVHQTYVARRKEETKEKCKLKFIKRIVRTSFQSSLLIIASSNYKTQWANWIGFFLSSFALVNELMNECDGWVCRSQGTILLK
jgi:hypothetical protein